MHEVLFQPVPCHGNGPKGMIHRHLLLSMIQVREVEVESLTSWDVASPVPVAAAYESATVIILQPLYFDALPFGCDFQAI